MANRHHHLFLGESRWKQHGDISTHTTENSIIKRPVGSEFGQRCQEKKSYTVREKVTSMEQCGDFETFPEVRTEAPYDPATPYIFHLYPNKNIFIWKDIHNSAHYSSSNNSHVGTAPASNNRILWSSEKEELTAPYNLDRTESLMLDKKPADKDRYCMISLMHDSQRNKTRDYGMTPSPGPLLT